MIDAARCDATLAPVAPSASFSRIDERVLTSSTSEHGAGMEMRKRFQEKFEKETRRQDRAS